MLLRFVLVVALASTSLLLKCCNSGAGGASPKQLVLEILMTESGVGGTNQLVFLRIFSNGTVQFHPKRGQDLNKTHVSQADISRAQLNSIAGLLEEEDVKNLPSTFRSTYTPIDFNWVLDMNIPRGPKVQQIKLINFYPATAKQNKKPYPEALLRLACTVLALRNGLNAETPYSEEECRGFVAHP